MDAVYTAGLIFVNLMDGVFHPGLSEVRLFLLCPGIKGVFYEGVGVDPVFRDDLAQRLRNGAAAVGEGRADGLGLIQNGHDARLHRQPDSRRPDGVQPVTERVHIPAQPGDDIVGAAVLLLLQKRDLRFQRAAARMALGRACYRDGESIAEFLTDEGDQLAGGLQLAAGTGPAGRRIAPQGQHIMDAAVQISLKLGFRALRCIADAGEVRGRQAPAVFCHPAQNLQILSHIRAAGTVGAGDRIRAQRIQLGKDAAAQLLHTRVSPGREHLEGEGLMPAQRVYHRHTGSS